MEMILINGGIAYSKKLPYSFIHAYTKKWICRDDTYVSYHMNVSEHIAK
jgi:hypothetical protein